MIQVIVVNKDTQDSTPVVLPCDPDEARMALERCGISDQEYDLIEHECLIEGILPSVRKCNSLSMLNYLAYLLVNKVDPFYHEVLAAVVECFEFEVPEIINLALHGVENCTWYKGITNDWELGQMVYETYYEPHVEDRIRNDMHYVLNFDKVASQWRDGLPWSGFTSTGYIEIPESFNSEEPVFGDGCGVPEDYLI